jgi:hypothetical protein
MDGTGRKTVFAVGGFKNLWVRVRPVVAENSYLRAPGMLGQKENF